MCGAGSKIKTLLVLMLLLNVLVQLHQDTCDGLYWDIHESLYMESRLGYTAPVYWHVVDLIRNADELLLKQGCGFSKCLGRFIFRHICGC